MPGLESLRAWGTIPFEHGPCGLVVKHSTTLLMLGGDGLSVGSQPGHFFRGFSFVELGMTMCGRHKWQFIPVGRQLESVFLPLFYLV